MRTLISCATSVFTDEDTYCVVRRLCSPMWTLISGAKSICRHIFLVWSLCSQIRTQPAEYMISQYVKYTVPSNRYCTASRLRRSCRKIHQALPHKRDSSSLNNCHVTHSIAVMYVTPVVMSWSPASDPRWILLIWQNFYFPNRIRCSEKTRCWCLFTDSRAQTDHRCRMPFSSKW